MFTGLIETTGRIERIRSTGTDCRFLICPEKNLSDLKLGESIAVNGACLTVEEVEKNAFLVYASAETLAKTTLSTFKTRQLVNLERALALGDRLGGHMVTGHVDCQAQVDRISAQGESNAYWIYFPEEWNYFLVSKGSVALDGISLTINDCQRNYLQVNIIPATMKETNVNTWQKGLLVNMETDIIAKYVQKMVYPWQPDKNQDKTGSSGITEEFLRQQGF